MRIIETDNHGGDYPDEKFVTLPWLSQESAERIAEAINKELCWQNACRRYWKVVPDDYKPEAGFQP